MSFCRHFCVLLKKNFITLKRSYCFVFFLILLPIATMGLFTLLQYQLSSGIVAERNNLDKAYFTSTYPYVLPSDESNIQYSDTALNFEEYTSVMRCSNMGLQNFSIIAPSQAILDMFEESINLLTMEGLNFQQFQNQQEAFDVIMNEDEASFCFVLAIDKFDTQNDDYQLQISYQKTKLPDTNLSPYNLEVRTPNFNAWSSYQNTGFMGIYQIIFQAILKAKQRGTYQVDVAYVPMKTPEYSSISSSAIDALSQNFPFFVMFTFLIPLYYIVSKFAEEKETKLREGMKMMGLKDSSYFCSWFVFYVIIIAVMSLIMMGVLSINVFPNSNKLLVFLFAFVYGLTLFGFALVVVSLLPNQRSSATAATLLHIISYFITYAVKDSSQQTQLKIGVSILPNIGMSFCAFSLYNFENNSNGITFDNIMALNDNMSFFWGLMALCFDFVFYILLGLYLDQVIPSQYGVARRWYFICQCRFWCGIKRKKKIENDYFQKSKRRSSLLDASGQADSIVSQTSYSKRKQSYNDEEELREKLVINSSMHSHRDAVNNESINFEEPLEFFKKQESDGLCLQIEGLRKKFGQKVAVNNSNITMYSSQIFALLGHNGAGKTTTISMLTGMLKPDRGKCEAFGIDVFEQMDSFRQILGVCPQHDILFESLSPKEHLYLFASFKGQTGKQLDSEVSKMLVDLELERVQNAKAKTLSGGQRRKLSVGCAMIGSSKIIILDEPTSGLDTTSRRKLWDMLKQNKQGKIIILTTHYMDEADILGDRIAIMSEGKIQCCGSSLFLKNRYGAGYNLTVQKLTRKPAPQIDQFVLKNIEGANKVQEVSSEILYQLPIESSKHFQEFFDIMDNNLQKLGIRTYGVGITSLEEVFLKIGDMEFKNSSDNVRTSSTNKEKPKKKVPKKKKAYKVNFEDYLIEDKHQSRACAIFCTQLGALLKKKFLIQLRDFKTLIIELIFPIILIFGGLALASVQIFKEGEPRELSSFTFPSPCPIYYNSPYGDSLFSYYFTNEDQWQLPAKAIQYDELPTSTNFQTQLLYFDNQLYEKSKTTGVPLFGEYFIYNLQNAQNAYAAVVFANATSQDAVAVFGHEIHTIILKDIIGNPNLKLSVTSQPQPLNKRSKSIISAATGTQSIFIFAVAFMMISSSLISNIIQERKRNVKYQMMISGLNLPAYWMSHYIVDLIFSAFPIGGAVGAIYLFELDMPYSWVILLVFFAVNPIFIYALSFFFDNDSTASILTRLLYIMVGGILSIAVQFMSIISDTQEASKILKWIFMIFPIFSLNLGIQQIASRQIIAIINKSTPYEPLDLEISGYPLIYMIGGFIAYFFLIIISETRLIPRMAKAIVNCCKNKEEEIKFRANSVKFYGVGDEDVAEEERRVARLKPEKCILRVNKLRKLYSGFPAVEKVSFALEYGECFALLGISGAGKTTTFKCLTREVLPTFGDLSIKGLDLTSQSGFAKARRLIGYCPQFDAIFERLTVKEHLQFYAKIKGILPNSREQLVERALIEMDLKEYENIRAERLSGGNKRKLSVAMAILGNPPLIFLDEPSTGVDPKAKRFMWSIISKISTLRKNSSVIITTHSMDEAEALCTKMGIMVKGRFTCFGSSQHIKSKYGTVTIHVNFILNLQGYEIELKIKPLAKDDLIFLKSQYQIEDHPVVLKQISAILKKFSADRLFSQIKEEGSGSDFYHQLMSEKESIDIDDLLRWVYTETRGDLIVELLKKTFKKVEIIEHYNQSFRIKIGGQNQSIGYLFGLMERIKQQYDIQEYSIQQTSLEQIFNNFAKQAQIQEEEFRKQQQYFQQKYSKTADDDSDY